jgi:hypothetical protein
MSTKDNDRFGQVFKLSGFVSHEGSLTESRTTEDHYVIVTNWRLFEEHERSHADKGFNNKFATGLHVFRHQRTGVRQALARCGQGADNEGDHHPADNLIGSSKSATAARRGRGLYVGC